ncbi:cbb3-type cytochrome c oxidase subunit 3 [Sulfitobacter sp. LCG007]
MDTYSILREIADSWGLVLLMAFFLGCVIWAFRPGSGPTHRAISAIPLRDESAMPLRDEGAPTPGHDRRPAAKHTSETKERP